MAANEPYVGSGRRLSRNTPTPPASPVSASTATASPLPQRGRATFELGEEDGESRPGSVLGRDSPGPQMQAPLDAKPAVLTHDYAASRPGSPATHNNVDVDGDADTSPSRSHHTLSPHFAPARMPSPAHTSHSTPGAGASTGPSPSLPPAHPAPAYSTPKSRPWHRRRGSGGPSTPAPARVPPTPILTQTTAPQPVPEQPEFAELLTPAQLRRRKRPKTAEADAPAGLGEVAGEPVLAGPSRLGWTTEDGDLYRGATADPTPDAPAVPDEDAATVSSGSSGSSSWSWGSGRVAGATRAVVQRLGGAIGVSGRRGSTSSNDSSTASSGSSSSSSSDGAASRIVERLGRALTRQASRQTADSDDRPRRVHVPRRREFTLLLPPDDATVLDGIPAPAGPALVPPIAPEHSNRVITTPVLPPILEAVRRARAAAGVASLADSAHTSVHHHRKHPHKSATAPNVPVRRGGSAPGRSRTGHRTFVPPPVPRPAARTRVEALRGDVPIRPKSASDLLGLARPSSTTSLTPVPSRSSTLDAEGIPTQPTPMPSPALTETPGTASIMGFAMPAPVPPKPRAAWWLDVSCPTWRDLRDIGELLSLHPLTLEDVLHQDPREKLDTFNRLGYYFVVVRALDEQYFKYTPGSTDAPPGTEISAATGTATDATAGAGDAPHDPHPEKKERARRGWGFGRATGRAATKGGEKVEIVEDNPGKEGLEGVGVGGVNLYLVVFADGVVSFHFDDVSKHTTRVRDRLLSAPAHEPTSDWIAHGLLDSIVDAFFPLTGYVDGAVDDMDSLTIDPTRDPRKPLRPEPDVENESPADAPYADHIEDLKGGDPDVEWIEMDNKEMKFVGRLPRRSTRESFSARKNAIAWRIKRVLNKHKLSMRVSTTRGWFRSLLYLKLFFLPIIDARPHPHERLVGREVYDRPTMLKGMTNLRRLVTGLTRLLGGKHIVVASLLKRAAENARQHGHDAPASDVEAYLSDVHDHILLLQTSLLHYEYILSHCQPAYISYLNVSASTTRGRTDKLILALSTVSIGILPMQLITGVFSMNVEVPRNGIEDEPYHGPLAWWGGIAVAIFFVACGIVFICRLWRWRARVRLARIRGIDLPSTWDGFWGWA